MSLIWESKAKFKPEHIAVLEILYQPRPFLDRKPKRPFLQGFIIGLGFGGTLLVLGLLFLRVC